MSAVMEGRPDAADEQGGTDGQASNDQAGNALALVRKASLAEVDKIELGLVELEKRYKDVVFDVSTPKGLADAKAARHEIRQPRYRVPHVIKDWRAKFKSLADAVATKGGQIEERLLKLETPIDDIIKVREQEIEDEKARRAEEERQRVAAIRARIDNLRNIPDAAADFSAADLADVISDIDSLEPSEEAYAEFLDEAKAEIAKVRERIAAMLARAQAAEAAAAAAKELEERLARERAELAEREAALARREKEAAEALERQRILDEATRRSKREQEERDLADQRAALKAQMDAFQAEKDAAKAALQTTAPPAPQPEPAATADAGEAQVTAQVPAAVEPTVIEAASPADVAAYAATAVAEVAEEPPVVDQDAPAALDPADDAPRLEWVERPPIESWVNFRYPTFADWRAAELEPLLASTSSREAIYAAIFSAARELV